MTDASQIGRLRAQKIERLARLRSLEARLPVEIETTVAEIRMLAEQQALASEGAALRLAVYRRLPERRSVLEEEWSRADVNNALSVLTREGMAEPIPGQHGWWRRVAEMEAA